jgi:uncharacterized tellurite resistance protein B-like protein
MLNQIKLFFEQHLALPSLDTPIEAQIQLATVALFMEMMVMDDVCQTTERSAILSLTQKCFSLTAEQVETLIASAEKKRMQAVDYYEFTSLINQQCSLEEKIQFIQSLWKIAFSDGVLDPHEEYLVRKLADLLYVPHTDFIKAKLRVKPKA